MSQETARERIIEAAEELYYRKGYAAVGMDELRAHAGVSLRKLYSEFAAKNDVILAVLEGKHVEWETQLSARVNAAGSDPRERLLAVYAFLEDWFCASDFRGCAFINTFGELGGTQPDVARAVREHKASFQRYMASLVREAGGDDALAAQLSILAEGAQSTAAIAGDPAAAAHARRAARTLIESAVGSSGLVSLP